MSKNQRHTEAAREVEEVNVARLLNNLSKNPPKQPGSFTGSDATRNVNSATEPGKTFVAIDTVHTPDGMIAESYMGPDKTLYVMFRGSEVIGADTLKAGSQSYQDWIKTNAQNHGIKFGKHGISTSHETPVQMIQASQYLESMLKKYPDADVVVGGHSKGGAEATYSAAMNKDILQHRNFRVISENGDSLLLTGAFRDIQAKNNGIRQDDPFFTNNFEQVRVESASGYKEVVSSANQHISTNIYLGQIKTLRMPIDKDAAGYLRDATGSIGNMFHIVENHGADSFEVARNYDIATRNTFGNDSLSSQNAAVIQSAKDRISEVSAAADAAVNFTKRAGESVVESAKYNLAAIDRAATSIVPPFANIADRLRSARKGKSEAISEIKHGRPSV